VIQVTLRVGLAVPFDGAINLNFTTYT